MRSSHTATPKPPELASSTTGAPASQAESQMPSTPGDTATGDSAKNDTSSAAPTNSADAGQPPRKSEAKEGETASAAKQSADASPKEASAKEVDAVDAKDSRTDDNQVASKPASKDHSPVEQLTEEPKHPSKTLLTASGTCKGEVCGRIASKGYCI